MTIDMTITTGHYGRMKVSSVELKTRLGHYLKTVERSGIPVEVCVRDQPVAFLIPHRSGDPFAGKGSDESIRSALALERSGLGVEPAKADGAAPQFEPVRAADGRTDVSTVEAMRTGRDW